MNKSGYITTTNKYHFVMLTKKRRISIYMIMAFLRKIAEVQGVPQEKLDAALSDRKTIGETRKRIESCTFERLENGAGEYYHIEARKGNVIINSPVSENQVVVFEESKPKPVAKI